MLPAWASNMAMRASRNPVTPIAAIKSFILSCPLTVSAANPRSQRSYSGLVHAAPHVRAAGLAEFPQCVIASLMGRFDLKLKALCRFDVFAD
jgi:hypothetical protein